MFSNLQSDLIEHVWKSFTRFMYLSIWSLCNFLIYYVIPIFKFYVSFKICNKIKLVYFLKFIVHKINFEIVKSGMIVLIGREKVDVTDTDVIMS
jgi:hypothetical protein